MRTPFLSFWGLKSLNAAFWMKCGLDADHFISLVSMRTKSAIAGLYGSTASTSSLWLPMCKKDLAMVCGAVYLVGTSWVPAWAQALSAFSSFALLPGHTWTCLTCLPSLRSSWASSTAVWSVPASSAPLDNFLSQCQQSSHFNCPHRKLSASLLRCLWYSCAPSLLSKTEPYSHRCVSCSCLHPWHPFISKSRRIFLQNTKLWVR